MKTIRSILRTIVYWLSSFAVWISGNRHRSNRWLKSMKNRYAGKRCFVIGNGPSLTVEDLELLKNEVTFACNRIYRMFEKTQWRPTYYAITDESVARPEDIENVNAFECEQKFFRSQGWYAYRKIKGGCYIHSWYSRKYLREPAFSEDITKGAYTIATVTYVLLQIARYMGFSEIYLLGMDHKYATEITQDGKIVKNEGVKSYFGQETKREVNNVGATWERDAAYIYAEEYSRRNGFRIYNATRGGYLEIYERVNLDEVLKDKTNSVR